MDCIEVLPTRARHLGRSYCLFFATYHLLFCLFETQFSPFVNKQWRPFLSLSSILLKINSFSLSGDRFVSANEWLILGEEGEEKKKSNYTNSLKRTVERRLCLERVAASWRRRVRARHFITSACFISLSQRRGVHL